MVNHGRSKGCATCKQRRVKCDEARPECQSCQRLGLHCGGYKPKPVKIRFKDQSHKFYTEVRPKKASQDKDLVPSLRPLAEPDTAVPFFLQHFALMGRDMESTRGFFEILVPVYCSQRQDSALSLAVSAVASEMMSLWRQDTRSPEPQKAYAQALRCLRSTIQDQNEWGKPATALAVLCLQFYENLSAICRLRSATRAHHDGAVSLIPFGDSDNANKRNSAYIRRFIFHSEVTSAMRQKRPLHSIAYSYIGNKAPTAAPFNPSYALDELGASVAELQASYSQLATQTGTTSSVQSFLRDWWAEAKCIDEQLLAWARSTPKSWQPVKITSEREIDASIPTYQSVCEVYPSCQIGTIWNLWRIQRLLLVKIILSSLSTTLALEQSQCTRDETLETDEDFVKYKHTLQELVDSVCHSVPFYLGNLAGQLSIPSFTDPAILFPSYRLLGPRDKSRLNEQSQNSQGSKDEHKGHLIAQGPWHVMDPLSRLSIFFLEDHGELMAKFLRPGQHQWIREQFLRASTLLGMPLADNNNPGGYLGFSTSSGQGSLNDKIDDLAKRVKKGACYMSGV